MKLTDEQKLKKAIRLLDEAADRIETDPCYDHSFDFLPDSIRSFVRAVKKEMKK